MNYLLLEGSRMRHRKNIVLILCFVFTCLALGYYLQVIGSFGTSTKFFHKSVYQWKPEYSILNGPDIRFDDPRLLKKLRDHHMHQWTTNNYNLTNSTFENDPSMGQSQIIRNLFKNDNKDKFFIECGALDGELRSNTLYLERVGKWEGLLIEADPSNYKDLVGKRRKSWASDSCMSTKTYPTMVSFEQRVNQGRISSFTAGYVEKGFVDAQCYPFATYMTFLNRTRVDYFSLDVEGVELEILKTIDFKKFDLKVLSVEFIHDKEGKDAIRDFMLHKGYYVLAEVTHPNWLANDFIFVKEGFGTK